MKIKVCFKFYHLILALQLSAQEYTISNVNTISMQALKKIEGIMLRGKWISKNKVQQELDRIEQKMIKYGNLLPNYPVFNHL